MHVWRICKAAHLSDPFSGEGARRAGGGWNHKGDPVVYTSSSLSLACLEMFVHLDPGFIPGDLQALSAVLPSRASVETVSISDLPADWREYPAPSHLQDLGSQWIRKRRTLALIVPSAINPEETNVLLNPLHPQIPLIRELQSRPFQFDPRMWK